MVLAQHIPRASRGVVVAHVGATHPPANEHERVALLAVASRLAKLRGDDDGGAFDPHRLYDSRPYFVPSGVLDAQQARALGIRGPRDLYGGVVPRAFVATKAINHPLATAVAPAPAGWNPAFAAQVRDTVLKGSIAFTPGDARIAGRRLLMAGPVRIKPARAGRGQSVALDRAALEQFLACLDPDEMALHGVVIEEEMQDTQACSVGEGTVGQLTASHVGVKRLIRDRKGGVTSRSCDLTVVRGGFDALLDSQPSAELRLVIARCRQFDGAIRSCFLGFFASRCNYDALSGRDTAGRPRCGVLKPSWRIDGATVAVIAAMERLTRRPECTCVRTSSVEVYGGSPLLPEDAILWYRGNDPLFGPLTSYFSMR
jgi:hypothetical protein